MPYQLVTCPVCKRAVQATVRRGEQHLSVGIHTRLDGTGILCEGTGHVLAPSATESHS